MPNLSDKFLRQQDFSPLKYPVKVGSQNNSLRPFLDPTGLFFAAKYT
jgi:hypothetical protein